jgi:PAS domain S-box-containing protein
MKDKEETKEQLISELGEMRRRISKLEAVETECKKGQEALRQEKRREHKQLEGELARSEAKYRSLVEETGSGIATIDIAGKITFVNNALGQILGYSKQEILGKPFASFLHPDDKNRMLAIFRETSTQPQGKLSLEFRVVGRYGNTIHMSSTPTVTKHENEICGFSAIMEDITERRRLEDRTAYLASFPELNPNVVFELDQKGNISYLNPTGRSAFPDLTTLGVKHPFLADWAQVVRELKSSNWAKTVVREVVVDSSFYEQAIYPVAENQIRLYGIDSTERKKAEAALLRAEQNFRNSMDASPLGIRIVDSLGKTLYSNKALLDIQGYDSLEELSAIPVEKRYTPESYAEHILRRERRRRGESVPDGYEIGIVRKDGQVRYLDVLRKEVIWDGNAETQVLYRDISERKRSEKDMERVAKLESLGILASGIAHDFNNLLTGILGNVQLAKLDTQAGETSRATDELLEAEKVCLRAKGLTQQLLTLSRSGAPIEKVVSIKRVVEESAAFALRGSNVRCEFSIPDGLWAVLADE